MAGWLRVEANPPPAARAFPDSVAVHHEHAPGRRRELGTSTGVPRADPLRQRRCALDAAAQGWEAVLAVALGYVYLLAANRFMARRALIAVSLDRENVTLYFPTWRWAWMSNLSHARSAVVDRDLVTACGWMSGFANRLRFFDVRVDGVRFRLALPNDEELCSMPEGLPRYEEPSEPIMSASLTEREGANLIAPGIGHKWGFRVFGVLLVLQALTAVIRGALVATLVIFPPILGVVYLGTRHLRRRTLSAAFLRGDDLVLVSEAAADGEASPICLAGGKAEKWYVFERLELVRIRYDGKWYSGRLSSVGTRELRSVLANGDVSCRVDPQVYR